jgi:hypothetical protein
MPRKPQSYYPWRAALVFVSLSLPPQLSVACEVRLCFPTEFDTTEYVFIGRVVDVVGPLRTDIVVGDAYGLLIKAEQVVSLPDSSIDCFEVFSYGITPSCTPEGRSRTFLSDAFPIGSEVRVIAKRSRFFPSTQSGDTTRLDAWLLNGGSHGSIARNLNDITSATSVFNYRKSSEAGRELIQFELRKDLLRLKNARSLREKMIILRRLMQSRSRWFLRVLEAHVSGEYTKENLRREFRVLESH